MRKDEVRQYIYGCIEVYVSKLESMSERDVANLAIHKFNLTPSDKKTLVDRIAAQMRDVVDRLLDAIPE